MACRVWSAFGGRSLLRALLLLSRLWAHMRERWRRGGKNRSRAQSFQAAAAIDSPAHHLKAEETKKLFVTAALILVCTFFVVASAYDSSAVKAAPAVSAIKSASFTRPDGSKVNFVANVEKGHFGVAFLSGGNAVSYLALGADLRGSIVLTKASTFGRMDDPEKVRLTIVSLDDTRVKIHVVPLG